MKFKNFNIRVDIHGWGIKKGKKGLKDLLKLFFTNNISMKQI